MARGRALTAQEQARYRPWFGAEVLALARVVEDRVPFWLWPSMQALVLGHTIYLRAGVYDSASLAGMELLAHELTHVEQFHHGLRVAGYVWASRRGYRHNPYEIAAYTKAAYIRDQLAQAGVAA